MLYIESAALRGRDRDHHRRTLSSVVQNDIILREPNVVDSEEKSMDQNLVQVVKCYALDVLKCNLQNL